MVANGTRQPGLCIRKTQLCHIITHHLTLILLSKKGLRYKVEEQQPYKQYAHNLRLTKVQHTDAIGSPFEKCIVSYY